MTLPAQANTAPSTRFDLPPNLTATEPPEHRGLGRDGVRLLVAEAVPGHGHPGEDVRLVHSRFRELGRHLRPGDLVVVNTSQTVAGEVDGVLADTGRPVVLHVATPAGPLPDGSWVLELRTAPDAARPLLDACPGTVVRLAEDVAVRLLAPYPEHAGPSLGVRLWRAEVSGSRALPDLLARHGRPISYGYLHGRWPLADYQTVFGRHPGSAEMPSAGRPFSPELVTDLVSRGIGFAPITLHTGVSSQEAGEPPQAERFEVPAGTARLVNATRLDGGRVIAVGTTVTRALESAADAEGWLSPARGWTELVIGPDHPARAVTGLITGLHNPDASHLLLVESVAGAELAQRAYDAAVSAGYLWHEFGDSCLLLGNRN
ncbi:S-adenosylmethionine:tRNA ribosyltransferase-isomerase [Jatrophihabitans sp.]|uniref:S-adenosylmethionine:tRNA ribosyltransferase-isomerase n=1 Tax=Jatrophihabitans sp. TaxID=1932789 RepID=UPI002CF7128E|nr:S-adenosylmethionine:tRNA ribosyltransferase-isomerase [Jatrophihabitans sp.]